MAIQAPDLDQAEKAIHTAMEIQEERQCRCDLSWSRLVLGQVLTAKGDLGSATKVYGTAGWMFEELGIDRGQEITDAALDALGADQHSAVSSAD